MPRRAAGQVPKSHGLSRNNLGNRRVSRHQTSMLLDSNAIPIGFTKWRKEPGIWRQVTCCGHGSSRAYAGNDNLLLDSST